MNTLKRLVPIIFALFLGACAADSAVDCSSGACDADSAVDCSKTSVVDCESEGCSLKTGNIFNEQDLCLDATQTFGCEAQNFTSNRLQIIGFKGGVCGHFFNEPPEGWIEAEEGDCSEFMLEAPLCEFTPKCEDLRPSDCLSPRCVVLEGRRFVGPMDGVDSVGYFEAPEPLGCMTANSLCGNVLTAGEHDGACYLFSSTCIPKGWAASDDCINNYEVQCE